MRKAIATAGAVFITSGLIATPTTASTVFSTRSAVVPLHGAGSTFDAPFFTKAFGVYQRSHNVTLSYDAVGSGAGIKRFIDGSVDFGASDVPMNSKELSAARRTGGPVEQIPIALGGVAIAYHLDGVKSNVRLSGPVLADIFLGHISVWNDPAIAKLNPGVKLPDFGITPVFRTESSGTSYIFTDYLSHVSPAWKAQIGTAKMVYWPSGVSGIGNDGVAGLVQRVPGAIGYVELSYVLTYHFTSVKLQNAAGRFVLPAQSTIAAAAASLPHVSATHYSIVNAPGQQSYPISGYSWVILRQHSPKAQTLNPLFQWMATTGQKYAAQLDYVPLPPAIQSLATRSLAKVR